MSPQPRKPILFHAGGHAFSASFERPVPHHVEAVAAVNLPTIGGHGHARVDDFEVPRLVRFKRAHSHVTGSFQDDRTGTSQVTTTILGLSILDVITADRITARLTSEHTVGKPEGHMLSIGSVFEGLRIGGYEFKIKLRHDLLMECKTYDQLAKRVATDEKSGKIARTENKVTVCSLVEEIETDFPGLSARDKKRHVVEIPHLGTLSFAEMVCLEGTKTLTMLRFDLGSPDGGNGVVAEAVVDGPQYPPPKG